MSIHNTIITRRELSKVFDREDVAEFLYAARVARPTRASRMVSHFASSVGNFLDKYRHQENPQGGVLESADDQPTSLLQDFLAERAEEIGAIEPLPTGGFRARLDAFRLARIQTRGRNAILCPIADSPAVTVIARAG